MNPAPYADRVLPVEARVTDLLTRMTVAEKCAQLVGPFELLAKLIYNVGSWIVRLRFCPFLSTSLPQVLP
jgi:hypothetical protein